MLVDSCRWVSKKSLIISVFDYAASTYFPIVLFILFPFCPLAEWLERCVHSNSTWTHYWHIVVCCKISSLRGIELFKGWERVVDFFQPRSPQKRKMDIGVPKSINSARSLAHTHALPALLSSYIFTTAYSFLSSRAALSRLLLIEETLLWRKWRNAICIFLSFAVSTLLICRAIHACIIFSEREIYCREEEEEEEAARKELDHPARHLIISRRASEVKHYVITMGRISTGCSTW